MAGWFGLLGIVAAMALVIFVPAILDLDAVILNPGEAYGPPKLGVLLIASVPLLLAVAGILIFRGQPILVPVLIPALALLGVSVLSTVFSDHPFYTLSGDRGEGLLSLVGLVLLFYALARSLTSWARVRLFLAVGVSAAALISVFGLVQNFGIDTISGWNNQLFSDIGRPPATVGNALTLAAYLTPMIGAATALYLGAASRARRVGWLLALALIGACWISTESRGALLGAGIALPVVLLVARHKMGTVQPLLVPLATLAVAMAAAVAASAALGFSTLSFGVSAALVAYLALVGALAWITRRGPARRLLVALAILAIVGIAAVAAVVATGSLSSLDDATGRDEGTQVSIGIRLLVWRDTLGMVLDRPLLGHGPDNYEGPFTAYISDELRAAITSPSGEAARVDRAHNDLLHTAATTGLLGLAAYLWIFVSYFRDAYARGGWTLAALSGGVLAYFVQLQTAFPSIVSNVAFWSILGTSVALMRLRDSEVRTTGEPETGDGGTLPRPPVKGIYELLVVAAVAVLLAVMAVSASLEQRENAAMLERQKLRANVTQAVEIYSQAEKNDRPYPEAGTYTETNLLKPSGSDASLRPFSSVDITTTTSPDGGFTVTGESTVLVGTFTYAYDSATGEYTKPPE